MSDSAGKRPGSIIVVVSVVVALAVGGVWWYKATRPKPVAKPKLVIVGVGLYLGRNQETHQFQIRKTFPHSPAEQAGLVPGLVLNRVNGVLAETKNIKDLSALLMGPVGTKVTVETIDTNTGATNEVELVREKFVNRALAP